MEIIDKLVKSPTPPESKHVIWFNTLDDHYYIYDREGWVDKGKTLVDDHLSETSENPVQNKVITNKTKNIDTKVGKIESDINGLESRVGSAESDITILQNQMSTKASKTELEEAIGESLDDIQEAMENLPDGQSVSAQVALNTTAIEGLEEDVSQLGQEVIYDVTKNNPTAGPNNDGKFESLSVLLSDANLSTLIPVTVRCGGMSIRFAQSSDNKYVQFRCIANSFTTDVTQWQNYDILDSAVSDILDLQEESITPTVYASGKYVDWDLHKLMTLSSYSVSNPIKLNVGDKIKVHSAANSAISIISLCNESMTEFSCLVQGPTNQTIVNSEYQATKDCYVCISWLTDAGITAKIFYSATISYLSEQNQKVVGNNKIDVAVEAAIEGKYVDWDAQKIMVYSPYNVSKPIRLFNGDVITGKCAGNNAISLLSLCDKCLVHFTRLIQGPDPQNYKTFTYTATEDCYVCLSYLAAADVSLSIKLNVSLEVLRNSIENIDIENTDKNPLYGKVVTFEGDSICAGLGSSEGIYGEGWASRIGIDNDMNWLNRSVSGSTIESIADRIQYYESISHRKVDYFIFEGGTNDADTMGAENLGEISPLNSFDGNYGTTTFYERMERLIKMIITYNPNAKIGYIVAPKMGAGSAYNNRRVFFDAAINCCKKWGIPYLDLWSENPMNPNLQVYWDGVDHETASEATQAGCYYIDGQHLSQLGYDYIYTQIEEWMKTL